MNDERVWVRIERLFDGPMEMVWQLWTDPKLFRQWYGPNGMSVPTVEMDVRVGGTRKVCMEMQSAERSMSMWFTGVYKEVQAPRRLVYTESMCDENGTIIPPQQMGMPDDFPDVTEVVVELIAEGNQTRMVMIHVGVEEGTAGAGGWNQAFDKFGALISDLSNARE